ncbi:MAG TPA: radical SAM protein [Gemmatimonadales bacterium]|nr:radical SAM protein [Gemmatimonadales bacterium]
MRMKTAGKRVSGYTRKQEPVGKQDADGRTGTPAEGTDQIDLLPTLPAYPPTRLPILDERSRGTKFMELAVSSVLNTPASTHMDFWSINPYVGCEFGCMYCYARDTHRWTMERAIGPNGGTPAREGVNDTGIEMGSHPTPIPPYRRSSLPPEEAFEKEILVKSDVAEVLARTLNPAKLAGHSLVIGTATDPYQPAERQFRLTRRILEVLRAYHGLSIEIITKSSLVTRDLDLLQDLSTRHDVTVNISLATADARLARLLELRSPVPAARLRALHRLIDGGIYAGLLVAPIIPGVTDDWSGLARLMEAAKEAGARYVVGSALRLGPAARHRFLPFLTREFPALAERYRRHYAGRDHVTPSYEDALNRRLRLLKQTYGFPTGEGMRRRRQGRVPPEREAVSSEQARLL